MENLLPIASFLLGAFLSFLVTKRIIPQNPILQKEYEALKTANVELVIQKDTFKTQQETTLGECKILEEEIRSKIKTIATLEAEKKSLNEKLDEQQGSLQKVQAQLKLEFENLANKIFEEKNTLFKEQSQKGLQDVLNPLKEKLAEFQKKVDESFGNQAKEQFALKGEIARIVEVSKEMTGQTESLTKALKGDIRAQGNWGEIILEKILEASGLRKDEDYVLHGADMGLRHPEDGRIQRPDVIVKLPENKHIIIDSKVSLTAYERCCTAQEENERYEQLGQFLDSMRTHIVGLEERRYQDTDKLGTPDFVLMFVPIEGAYSLAMQHDRELLGFAWDKKIIVVCPTTLFATLRTIASMWKLELQNKNAQEIAKRGGALYDKIAGFIKDMVDMGKQINNTQTTYENALNKLSQGRGNILRQAEQLRELGAKTTKAISLVSEKDEEETTTDSDNQAA